MARSPRAVVDPGTKEDGPRAAVRERVFPQGWKPRACVDRYGCVRRATRPGRLLRRRPDGAETVGRGTARERGAFPDSRTILFRRVLGIRCAASLHSPGVRRRYGRRTRVGL